MEYKIGLAQSKHPKDGDVVSMAESYIKKAAGKDLSLIAFPECLMSPYEMDKGAFLKESQPLDGSFATSMNELAAKYGVWVVYTMNELNPEGLPYNTAVVAGADGEVKGFYRKVHLFDSSTTQESSRMSASNQLFEPIDTPFGKLGLATCYDLRFPEVARKQALAGCDLLIYPAAWVNGPTKTEQWATLLKARAIENEIFVAGVCRSDHGYCGNSLVAGPDGEPVAQANRVYEGLLEATIETSKLDAMRNAIPVMQHRRPELY